MAYDDLLKIRTWSRDGAKTSHITELVQSKTWSGSYQDCARKLTYTALPEALSELGGRVRLYGIVTTGANWIGEILKKPAFNN